MITIEYVGEQRKLSKVILEEYKKLSYSNLQKLLRKKDIKVNGKRTSSDILVNSGDRIEVYAPDEMLDGTAKVSNLKIAYEDQNILVVDKASGIEVVSISDKNNLENLVDEYLGGNNQKAKAVHRIDRNTRGLVIFAKNDKSEKELLSAFKNHEIKKFYEAMVVGDLEGGDTLVGFLKVDKDKAIAHVVSSPRAGYEKIITK